MTALDRLLPAPRLVEIDSVDVGASPERVWELVRHGDLGRSSPLVRALFAIRELPAVLAGERAEEATLRIDQLRSSPEKPGFQVLAVEPPREIAVAAIGKVWQPEIPFVHVDGVEGFAAFATPGFVKVAWAIRVEPRGERDARVVVEVRVDATDDESWQKFRRYFRLIGPGSHFIRRVVLASLVRELGSPEAVENERALGGDDLLSDAAAQITHGITIDATPEEIWPWLVQMGCRRAGYYSWDVLDNGGVPSAKEIHPELQDVAVGDVLPATPDGDDGFEVVRIEQNRALVLGGLFDAGEGKQLAFAHERPARYWHVTWAFVLERLDANKTRLHVRARAAFASAEHFHAAWIRPVHAFMQTAQLRHLKARVEGRLPVDSVRDVMQGVGGAAKMVAALMMAPFDRHARSHWGVDEATAARRHPGDDLVARPAWSWTHGIEIDAPAAEVWPWIAQIGADRGGFYSYQWLENIAGCHLRNAETIHPEWEVKLGDALVLAPSMPPLKVVSLERERWFVAHGPADEKARAAGKSWAEVSWAFIVEPLGGARCRLISRYRCATSEDFATRVALGPTLVEPVGFVMDRRMLLGVKERVERALHHA